VFRWNLIRKIKKYLSNEYVEKSDRGILSSFVKCMKMDDAEDTFDDYVESDIPLRRISQPHHPTCPQRPMSADKNHVNQNLRPPEFLMTKHNVEKYIDESLEEITFAKKLNQYLYEKDITTAIIYKRCLVDRKLISKITTQSEYHPSKSTVMALCIGLQLSLPEGETFLSLAGYSFNRSSKRDLIIKFMLENKIYDLDTINEMLIYFKQPCFE